MSKTVFFFCLFLLSLTFSPVSFAQDLPAPKRELRAAWIATVVNIDWPTQRALNAHDQQKEFVELLDLLQSMKMNAVVVQVRPVADALFPSSYEPWSEYLSGEQGESPTPYYNPLTFMIEEARKRGLEFHAWFNPYRASMKEDFIHSKDHPINQHPEWFVEYGGKKYYDPGHPEAREYVLNAIMEVVRHYDLDAVHFDDYFYPYRIANEEFPDDSSYTCYGESYKNKEDWRRYNVDAFVEELHDRIRNEKPHVVFGISPFGVWRNNDKDPMGSDTKAGQTNYDDLYADVLKWLREGWIDYITPQLYWHIGFAPADYKVLVDWWSKHTYGRHMYIGQGIYRLGQKGWEDKREIINQINLNRATPNVHGSMYFSTKVFVQNKDSVQQKMEEMYPSEALIPVMPWLDDTPPEAPVWQEIIGNQKYGVKLQWQDSTPGDAHYYVVYRFDADEEINIHDPSKILATVPRSPYHTQSYTDRSTETRTQYRYLVTAVDRKHNESQVSAEKRVKTRGAHRAVKEL
ncbi:family 10 glycosylhydrolase [Fulvivirga sp. M361]|uniref:glycoside hydrolase family 10 protein n=1 Tax=Fulvivirga sp. M361 TaxID=2594266 RepID=UPI00117A84A5|nr:family 10 glycosylhydrolase [Fulvivirga sp. M361]TRX48616.1 family 10 glycosylhydrolase [Fulvivirga sp. M361]